MEKDVSFEIGKEIGDLIISQCGEDSYLSKMNFGWTAKYPNAFKRLNDRLDGLDEKDFRIGVCNEKGVLMSTTFFSKQGVALGTLFKCTPPKDRNRKVRFFVPTENLVENGSHFAVYVSARSESNQ